MAVAVILFNLPGFRGNKAESACCRPHKPRGVRAAEGRAGKNLHLFVSCI